MAIQFTRTVDGTKLTLNDKAITRVKINKEEVISLFDNLTRKDENWSALVVGSRRFSNNEPVTITVNSDKSFTLKGNSNDKCLCTFAQAENRDAVVDFAYNSVSLVDDHGAAIVLYIRGNKPVYLDEIIPMGINRGECRGESLLFTGAAFKTYIGIAEKAVSTLNELAATELNYLLWVVYTAITRSSFTCKNKFSVIDVSTLQDYDCESNMCTLTSTLTVSPEDVVSPAVYEDHIRATVIEKFNSCKGGSAGTSITVSLLPAKREGTLEFCISIKRKLSTYNKDAVLRNNDLVSAKLRNVLSEIFKTDVPKHIAHYTVPVDFRKGNHVYAIVAGLGVSALSAITDKFNTDFSEILEEPVQSVMLDGTESWMLRVYFKDQEK